MARRRRQDNYKHIESVSPVMEQVLARANTPYSSQFKPMTNNHAQRVKRLTENMFTRVLSELALNRYRWVGLPNGVDSRYLEMSLLYHGLVVFFHDQGYNRHFALRASGVGQPNMYDNPTKFTVYNPGVRLPKTEWTARECVPIWCNMQRIPEGDIIFHYADKLSTIDRTVDINLMQQRIPFIVSASETQRKTAATMMRNWTEGELAIFTTDGINPMDMVQAFNTGISDDLVLNTLLAKQKVWNECLTLLGINNANQDKRERLVSDEVAANDEQVEASRGMGLKTRQVAAEEINRMFKLNVRCEWAPAPVEYISLGQAIASDLSNDGGDD